MFFVYYYHTALRDIVVESLETTYEASGMFKTLTINFNTGVS